MPDQTPTLITERLVLRAHRREDFDACLALWTDPHTVRFIGDGTVQGAQAIWFRLLRYGGMWPMQGYGFWVFEDKATGAYLGEGGLMDARRDLPGLDGLPEAGWALLPEAGGRGLATEAMTAVLAWADHALPDTPRIGAIIDPANAPSFKVAAKLGFAEVARPYLGGSPIVLLHRARQRLA
jgi:RimJ/RimL family protein N-acetyltransferase